jgi:hypothetical protein
MKMAAFWVVVPCSLVEVYQTTRRNNPEDKHLHTRSRENLKSHKIKHRDRVTYSDVMTAITICVCFFRRYSLLWDFTFSGEFFCQILAPFLHLVSLLGRRHTSMHRMGFEPTIPVLQRPRPVPQTARTQIESYQHLNIRNLEMHSPINQ